MNLIIDFYKDLDMINLIIFWGIILIIFLLLVFSIIIANKNKKLKRIIINKEHEIKESKNELAIKQNIITEEKDIKQEEDEFLPIKDTTPQIIINNTKEETPIIKDENINKEETININKIENNNTYVTKEKTIIQEENEEIPVKEETFVAEEYVMPAKEITIPNAPYQRNVLREMSLNQTSPIGITRTNPQKEILEKEKPEININNVEILEDAMPTETYKNNYREEMDNSKKMINKIYEQVNKSNDYLQEVSKKMEETAKNNEIKRTEYEIKQEEDAIISYEELMRKKDNIKIEDEEDAIISIEELKRQKLEKERIYNITKEEENDEFISELKDFRSDL